MDLNRIPTALVFFLTMLTICECQREPNATLMEATSEQSSFSTTAAVDLTEGHLIDPDREDDDYANVGRVCKHNVKTRKGVKEMKVLCLYGCCHSRRWPCCWPNVVNHSSIYIVIFVVACILGFLSIPSLVIAAYIFSIARKSPGWRGGAEHPPPQGGAQNADDKSEPNDDRFSSIV